MTAVMAIAVALDMVQNRTHLHPKSLWQQGFVSAAALPHTRLAYPTTATSIRRRTVPSPVENIHADTM
jgi:hypothetical protein